jgi:hypothetical protein
MWTNIGDLGTRPCYITVCQFFIERLWRRLADGLVWATDLVTIYASRHHPPAAVFASRPLVHLAAGAVTNGLRYDHDPLTVGRHGKKQVCGEDARYQRSLKLLESEKSCKSCARRSAPVWDRRGQYINASRFKVV